MGDFASGKYAKGVCDRSGFVYALKDLVPQIKDGKDTGLRVHGSMLDPDQPQLWLGRFPVKDPQAVRGPRPETGLTDQRNIVWNWSPVGDRNSLGELFGFSTQTTTQAEGEVGSVTVTTA
jgi:hypothetical protein